MKFAGLPCLHPLVAIVNQSVIPHSQADGTRLAAKHRSGEEGEEEDR
jgi:hypothetical protein